MKLTSKKLLKEVKGLENFIIAAATYDGPNKKKLLNLLESVNTVRRKLDARIHFANQYIQLLPKNFPRIGKTI